MYDVLGFVIYDTWYIIYGSCILPAKNACFSDV